MNWNMTKTALLFFLLTGLLLGISTLIGVDPITALLLAGVMNFIVYFFSDSIVLAMTRAKAVSPNEAPRLHRIVNALSTRAGIPKPRVYVVQNDTPNAFATGRNPSHAAVCVHTGLMGMLNDEEVEGVLAHELSHIRHYDTLIMVVAATIAGAIAMIGRIFYYSSLFGYNRRERGGGNAMGALVMMIVAPLAAMFIQFGISRTREYMADEGGARLTGNPLGLASALRKIDHYARHRPMSPIQTKEALSSLYIINPFKRSTIVALLSTHPPVAKRVERLERLASRM
ncbi:MAG: zinc metalloprotease HtpX [Candidatus Bathyarchaeia archaeon]